MRAESELRGMLDCPNLAAIGTGEAHGLRARQYQVTGDTVRERYQWDNSVPYHIACCVMAFRLLSLPYWATEHCSNSTTDTGLLPQRL